MSRPLHQILPKTITLNQAEQWTTPQVESHFHNASSLQSTMLLYHRWGCPWFKEQKAVVVMKATLIKDRNYKKQFCHKRSPHFHS